MIRKTMNKDRGQRRPKPKRTILEPFAGYENQLIETSTLFGQIKENKEKFESICFNMVKEMRKRSLTSERDNPNYIYLREQMREYSRGEERREYSHINEKREYSQLDYSHQEKYQQRRTVNLPKIHLNQLYNSKEPNKRHIIDHKDWRETDLTKGEYLAFLLGKMHRNQGFNLNNVIKPKNQQLPQINLNLNSVVEGEPLEESIKKSINETKKK